MAILFIIAGVLIVINMPIAFAVGIASLVYYVIDGTSLMVLPQAMTGAVDSFPLLCIPLFMFVGFIMNMSGVTKRIFNFASSLVGHLPGGLGHVNIVASIIFAGMSGSATADAAGLGAIEIQAMREEGFDDDFSAAVTASSSTIGPIIPPSMPMVIYGAIVGVSIGRLFLAGLLPGILMGISLMVMVYIISRKRNYPIRKRATLKEVVKSFISAFFPILTPVILLGGLVFGIFTPTEAAGVAAIYALFLGGVLYRQLNFKGILELCVDVAEITGTTLLILSTAYLVVWVITVNNVPGIILNILINMNLGKNIFLLVINLFLLFLGMFTTIAPSVILFGPLLTPVVIAMGIDPVHFGVIFVLNLMIGLLTPPVGPCLYIMSSLTNLSLERVVKSTMPFIIPLIIVLLIITYFPVFSLWLPTLLMG